MIESYCRASIWDKCREITGKQPIVCLKNEDAPIWEFEQFYRGMSGYGIIFDTRFQRKRGVNTTFRYAVGLLSRNGANLGQVWVNEKFDGDWLKAIRSFENFNELFNTFEEYFCERRKEFMDKTNELIKLFKPDLKNIKPIRTNSHGGVANLLKVLTKTMHDQGSTIQSIAKMQYCICVQAGIYVPEEFITDVLTAMDMSEEVINDKK